MASLVVQVIKYLPAVQETWVRSLGGEEPLEKGMSNLSTHNSPVTRVTISIRYWLGLSYVTWWSCKGDREMSSFTGQSHR